MKVSNVVKFLSKAHIIVRLTNFKTLNSSSKHKVVTPKTTYHKGMVVKKNIIHDNPRKYMKFYWLSWDPQNKLQK